MPAVALARLGHVHKVHLPLTCIKLISLLIPPSHTIFYLKSERSTPTLNENKNAW